jgi:hypothetical protein
MSSNGAAAVFKTVYVKKKPVDHHPPWKVIALVVTTVILFLLIFASASSWILFVTHALPGINGDSSKSEKFNIRAFGIFAGTMTLITLIVAVAFAFETRKSDARLPLDVSSVIKNITKRPKTLGTQSDTVSPQAESVPSSSLPVQPFVLTHENGQYA